MGADAQENSSLHPEPDSTTSCLKESVPRGESGAVWAEGSGWSPWKEETTSGLELTTLPHKGNNAHGWALIKLY